MNKLFAMAALVLLSVGIRVAAQQTEHRGIQLFKEGKNAEAVDVLRAAAAQKEFKTDAAIWNVLGLAYIATGDLKQGSKALETAVKLSPTSSTYHVNLAYVYLSLFKTGKARSEASKAIQTDPNNATAYYLLGTANLRELKLSDAEKAADRAVVLDPLYPQGYILKSNVLLMRFTQQVAKGASVEHHIGFLRQAFDSLKLGLERCQADPNKRLLDEEFESVEAFYKYFSREKAEPVAPLPPPDPGVRLLQIVRKPKPAYTDEARQAGITGTIQLAVLFGANGKVKYLLLVKGLGHGLDQNAMNAARKIEFTPKMKDGKEVSVVRLIEYTFNIY